jgi:hypothetical protein
MISFIVRAESPVSVFYVYSEPIFKRRFGHVAQVTLSLEAKGPPGLVAFEPMPVPYSVPIEWIEPEPEATTQYWHIKTFLFKILLSAFGLALGSHDSYRPPKGSSWGQSLRRILKIGHCPAYRMLPLQVQSS